MDGDTLWLASETIEQSCTLDEYLDLANFPDTDRQLRMAPAPPSRTGERGSLRCTSEFIVDTTAAAGSPGRSISSAPISRFSQDRLNMRSGGSRFPAQLFPTIHVGVPNADQGFRAHCRNRHTTAMGVKSGR